MVQTVKKATRLNLKGVRFPLIIFYKHITTMCIVHAFRSPSLQLRCLDRKATDRTFAAGMCNPGQLISDRN